MKKITFSMLADYLSLIEVLEPEIKNIDKIKIIHIRYNKHKIVFTRIVKELCKLVVTSPIKYPVFLKGYIQLLQEILKHTEYIEIKKKVDLLQDTENETGSDYEVLSINKKRLIKKSDYMNVRINSAYKKFIQFAYIPEEQFLTTIGFLEYDELINTLELHKLCHDMNYINTIISIAGSFFDNKALEKLVSEKTQRIEELKNTTFNKQEFEKAIFELENDR